MVTADTRYQFVSHFISSRRSFLRFNGTVDRRGHALGIRSVYACIHQRLFTDYEQKNKEKQEKEEERRKEKQIQKAILNVQKKYGKNALIKGMNLQEGATTMERNRQIGGHKA